MNFKKHLPWIIPVGIVVVLLFWIAGSYNGLVKADVEVDTAWGNVQTVYQRRADLIPNLIETVKGARDFEQETLTEVTQLRTQATQAQSQVNTANSPQQLDAAGSDMNSVLSRLLVIVENYPELKTNQNFLALQDELAGTENRISVERQRYNTAVGDYNKKTRTFPTVIIAGMFGFEQKDFFEADSGAENAPSVNFQ